MTFSVEDEQGKVRRLRAGPRARCASRCARSCARALARRHPQARAHRARRAGRSATIPKVVALPGTGQTIRAYPSLVDEGETVGLRALESPGAQALNMRAGTRRLLALTIPSPLRQYQGQARQRRRSSC